jgi:hypothetical protein
VGAAITDFDGVEIEGGYADLSVYDGALSKGAALTHAVTFPDFTPTASIEESNSCLVYPGVKLNIASITV